MDSLQLVAGAAVVRPALLFLRLDQETETFESDRLIAAADHLVRARALMRGVDLAAGLAALVAA